MECRASKKSFQLPNSDGSGEIDCGRQCKHLQAFCTNLGIEFNLWKKSPAKEWRNKKKRPTFINPSLTSWYASSFRPSMLFKVNPFMDKVSGMKMKNGWTSNVFQKRFVRISTWCKPPWLGNFFRIWLHVFMALLYCLFSYIRMTCLKRAASFVGSIWSSGVVAAGVGGMFPEKKKRTPRAPKFSRTWNPDEEPFWCLTWWRTVGKQLLAPRSCFLYPS